MDKIVTTLYEPYLVSLIIYKLRKIPFYHVYKCLCVGGRWKHNYEGVIVKMIFGLHPCTGCPYKVIRLSRYHFHGLDLRYFMLKFRNYLFCSYRNKRVFVCYER